MSSVRGINLFQNTRDDVITSAPETYALGRSSPPHIAEYTFYYYYYYYMKE